MSINNPLLFDATTPCAPVSPLAPPVRARCGNLEGMPLFLRASTVFLVLLASVGSLHGNEYLAIDADDQRSGPPFTYDPNSQYVRLTLKTLNVPPTTRENSNPIAEFFETLLKGRKSDFWVSTLEVTRKGQAATKSLLYSIKRNGNEFDFTVFGEGKRLTDPFVFDELLPVGIRVKRSEWQETEDVLISLAAWAGLRLRTS